MLVVQHFCGDLRKHRSAVTAHPFSFRVIEYRGIRYMRAAAQQMRHFVAVIHKRGKSLKLRIKAIRAEMRRTVRIRKIRRKRVRYKTVDAADKQKIKQPLHHRRILRPAVSAEYLAHRTSIHLCAYIRVRRR